MFNRSFSDNNMMWELGMVTTHESIQSSLLENAGVRVFRILTLNIQSCKQCGEDSFKSPLIIMCMSYLIKVFIFNMYHALS